MADVETVRLVTKALKDANRGVNAKIATLSTDAGETPPTVAAVLNEFDDDEVALGDVGVDFPAITVVSAGAVDGDAQDMQGQQDFNRVDLEILYVTEGADRAQMNRDAAYTLRAVRHALNDMLAQDENGSARSRNGVFLSHFTALTSRVANVETEGGQVVPRGMLLGCYVRDTEA